MKDNSNNNSIKLPWDCTNGYNVGEAELLNGFPWPPRSYTCSFCKREFRSAQALGGHMNVHRRDRARLRQSPPRDGNNYTHLNLNVKPNPNLLFNPNPKFSSPSPSSSPFTRFTPFTSTLLPSSLPPSPLSTSSPSSSFVRNGEICNHFSVAKEDLSRKTTKSLFGVEDSTSLKHEKRCSPLKEAEIVTLDLEIGMFNETKKDLDLELRLGYS